ncbi:serine/threonine-protein kinase EDR1-like isoform X1 [Vicia villosa]|uniref:serine/threonine-protein kinase EDR1-like isoform X1 n=1 Tax=Vicia villosa TaxID=3911 RepID=UPI00273CA89E|nr:serine/threonine-protein kinase EDR1-like isoform X1 [Vicia villosa]XP_058753578.1 serine/threonine-protein kinase EDR1-like isoform X1 [Vicia villosa]
MEETREDAGPSEQGSSNVNVSWWPSDFVEKFGSVALDSQDETVINKESSRYSDKDVLSPLKASQILWRTGMLSEPIPNGFYSVIPETRLKELFDSIPTLDELHALDGEGYRADIILVDLEKDKKLSMLKQLIVALVKGLNSNPAAIIKKIAGLVSDFYKRPSVESPAKAAFDETSHIFENRGVQMLGQIKHGSCRPRAILFKVLADTVGLESRLMVGLPNDRAVECVDSYKHMSVIVVLNSTEMLVDLMRFPGQLLPKSIKAVFMSHISAAGESDSAENDSCDSPLEPNSPLFGVSESTEKEENLQFYKRFEASSNVTGLSLRNMMLRSNSSLSLSHSEPNITTSFGRRSRRKVIAEQRTASSSPEHPSFRARARSMLSGDRTEFRDFADDQATSRSSYRSDGASSSEVRRIRRRSISITPEIGDDIVRAVRAMNETLKQNRLMRERVDDNSLSHSPNNIVSDANLQKKVSNFHHGHDERPSLYSFQRDQVTSQKATSLPSSPHDYRSHASERSELSRYGVNDETESTWNKVLESQMYNNKPLLPYEGWDIDFSELTVGTRVGIGFFGEVFRGIWNGTDVAIKVFLEQDLTAENMEDFCNEISILSRLRHPNVILFLGACTKPPRLSMVTEYMEMGSLYYLIHLSGQKKKLSWRRRLKMMRDICKGLMCIHRMKIVHRDLKSANCLVNKHWTVKICDFGLSRIMIESPIRDSSSAGTPEWMAPELIRNEPFDEKCDIFSLGVILWELYNLNRPWEGVPPERVVYSVAHEGSRLEVPEGPLGRLISDCWADAHERPSCDEILSRLMDMEYSTC